VGRLQRHAPQAALAAIVLAAAGLLALGIADGRIARAASATSEGLIAASAGLGLTVDEILVEGRVRTDSDDLREALGAERGTPILAFDPDAGRAAVLALPWVRSASVERRLPSTIFVHLEERQPLALWQNDHRLRLIDRDGVVLAERGLDRFATLPMVVGPDAHIEAAALLRLLAAEPAVASRVSAAVRIGGRRWDLKLDNGIAVRLPEEGTGDALRLLAAAAGEGLLERDILAIDLRMEDRLVVQITPLAAERRTLPEKSS
jgi:cell division protein FtsQ